MRGKNVQALAGTLGLSSVPENDEARGGQASGLRESAGALEETTGNGLWECLAAGAVGWRVDLDAPARLLACRMVLTAAVAHRSGAKWMDAPAALAQSPQLGRHCGAPGL